ncbi:hypothetical protein TBLA_0B04530 [Henningerozyma blattae CBS 6284]|uniref:Protein transport protein sec16 n=1 Tax=Henningerozyma blattae (strain ATCC 34711 / CBS 6284 / DSM 70876 / NBRC 10599 / NRRL Y-10934 / UCD 77-7) TaxID=1071380 RepID=I2GYT7_HENB6|nr:hypothetical protein TBLA_0B04530 [Tetrapisispora blattae CBS 6284]CCH59289.1 hypothetical protein TBLA_0B04530 [Tetrapisispora blattae CBS 6284]
MNNNMVELDTNNSDKTVPDITEQTLIDMPTLSNGEIHQPQAEAVDEAIEKAETNSSISDMFGAHADEEDFLTSILNNSNPENTTDIIENNAIVEDNSVTENEDINNNNDIIEHSSTIADNGATENSSIIESNAAPENNGITESKAVSEDKDINENKDISDNNGIIDNDGIIETSTTSKNNDIIETSDTSKNNNSVENNGTFEKNNTIENIDVIQNIAVTENNNITEENDTFQNDGVPENDNISEKNAGPKNKGIIDSTNTVQNNVISENNDTDESNGISEKNVVTKDNTIAENNDTFQYDGIPPNNDIIQNSEINEKNTITEHNSASENNPISEKNTIIENNGRATENNSIPEKNAVSENNDINRNNDNAQNNGIPENNDIVKNKNTGDKNAVTEKHGTTENRDIPANNDITENKNISEINDTTEDKGISENNVITENKDISANSTIPEHEDISENNAILEHENINENNTIPEHEGISENNVITEHKDINEYNSITEHEEISDNNGLAENNDTSRNDIGDNNEIIKNNNFTGNNNIIENHDTTESTGPIKANTITGNIDIIQNSSTAENSDNNSLTENAYITKHNNITENTSISENNNTIENNNTTELANITESNKISSSSVTPTQLKKKFSFLDNDDDLLLDDDSDSFLESSDDEPADNHETKIDSRPSIIDSTKENLFTPQPVKSKYEPSDEKPSDILQTSRVGAIPPTGFVTPTPLKAQLAPQGPTKDVKKFESQKKKTDAYDFPLELVPHKNKLVPAKAVAVPVARIPSNNGAKIPAQKPLAASPIYGSSLPTTNHLTPSGVIHNQPRTGPQLNTAYPSSTSNLYSNSPTQGPGLQSRARGLSSSSNPGGMPTPSNERSRSNPYAPVNMTSPLPVNTSLKTSPLGNYGPRNPLGTKIPPVIATAFDTATITNAPLQTSPPPQTNLVVPGHNSVSHTRSSSIVYTPNKTGAGSRYAPHAHRSSFSMTQPNNITGYTGAPPVKPNIPTKPLQPTSLMANSDIIPPLSETDNHRMLSRQFPVFSWGLSNRFAYGLSSFSAQNNYIGGMSTSSTISDIKIVTTDSILRTNELIKTFPGPLVHNKTKLKDVEKWLDKAIEDEQKNNSRLTLLIWSLLRLITSGNYDLKAISSIIFNSHEQEAQLNHLVTDSRQLPNAFKLDPNSQLKVLTLIQLGRRDEALNLALSKQDFSMAIIVSSLMGKNKWSEIVGKYLEHELLNNGQNEVSHSVTIFEIILEVAVGNGKVAVGKFYSNLSRGSWATKEWRTITASVLNNSMLPDSNQQNTLSPSLIEFLVEFGIFLSKRGETLASSILFMIAKIPLSNNEVLIETDVKFSYIANPVTSYSAIWSEIYAFCTTSDTKSMESTYLLAQKLYHAHYLQERGLTSLASKYIDNLSPILKSKAKSDPICMNLSLHLEELTTRISSSNNSWLTKPKLSSVWDQLDKSFNKYIGGDSDIPSKTIVEKKVFNNFTPLSSRNNSTHDLSIPSPFSHHGLPHANYGNLNVKESPKQLITPFMNSPDRRHISSKPINNLQPLGHAPLLGTTEPIANGNIQQGSSFIQPPLRRVQTEQGMLARNVLSKDTKPHNPYAPKVSNSKKITGSNMLESLSISKNLSSPSKPILSVPPNDISDIAKEDTNAPSQSTGISHVSPQNSFSETSSVGLPSNAHIKTYTNTGIDELIELKSKKSTISAPPIKKYAPPILPDTNYSISTATSSTTTTTTMTNNNNNVTLSIPEQNKEYTVEDSNLSEAVNVAKIASEEEHPALNNEKRYSTTSLNEEKLLKELTLDDYNTRTSDPVEGTDSELMGVEEEWNNTIIEHKLDGTLNNNSNQMPPLPADVPATLEDTTDMTDPKPVYDAMKDKKTEKSITISNQSKSEYTPIAQGSYGKSHSTSYMPVLNNNISLTLPQNTIQNSEELVSVKEKAFQDSYTPVQPIAPTPPTSTRGSGSKGLANRYAPSMPSVHNSNNYLSEQPAPVTANRKSSYTPYTPPISSSSNIPFNTNDGTSPDPSRTANEKPSIRLAASVRNGVIRPDQDFTIGSSRSNSITSTGMARTMSVLSSAADVSIIYEGGVGVYNDIIEDESESDEENPSTSKVSRWLKRQTKGRRRTEEKERSRGKKRKRMRRGKERKEKKKSVQNSNNSANKADANGWFGWLKKDPNEKKVIKAKLGHKSNFYYDEKLKRWISKDATEEEKQSVAAPPPPPPIMKKKKVPSPLGNTAPPPTNIPSSSPSSFILPSTDNGKSDLPNPDFANSSPSISTSPFSQSTPALENSGTNAPPLGASTPSLPIGGGPRSTKRSSNLPGKNTSGIDDLLSLTSKAPPSGRKKKKPGRGYVNVLEKN